MISVAMRMFEDEGDDLTGRPGEQLRIGACIDDRQEAVAEFS
jgi:hypothetical protein